MQVLTSWEMVLGAGGSIDIRLAEVRMPDLTSYPQRLLMPRRRSLHKVKTNRLACSDC